MVSQTMEVSSKPNDETEMLHQGSFLSKARIVRVWGVVRDLATPNAGVLVQTPGYRLTHGFKIVTPVEAKLSGRVHNVPFILSIVFGVRLPSTDRENVHKIFIREYIEKFVGLPCRQKWREVPPLEPVEVRSMMGDRLSMTTTKTHRLRYVSFLYGAR